MFPLIPAVLSRNGRTPYYHIIEDCEYQGEHPPSSGKTINSPRKSLQQPLTELSKPPKEAQRPEPETEPPDLIRARLSLVTLDGSTFGVRYREAFRGQ